MHHTSGSSRIDVRTTHYFLQAGPMAAGEVLVGNDPYCGGAHLPNITAFAPVYWAGQCVAYVGCRGHHIDIEIQTDQCHHSGVLKRRYPNIVIFRWDTIRARYSMSRRQDVRASLEAQYAVCVWPHNSKCVTTMTFSGLYRFLTMRRLSREWRLKWKEYQNQIRLWIGYTSSSIFEQRGTSQGNGSRPLR